MQYNYDFQLHHQLINASQMLGEFESFHYNRNVYNVSWYGRQNFLPAPHLIWCIDYQTPEKKFLIVFQKLMGKPGNFCFSTLSLREPRDLCQAKSML